MAWLRPFTLPACRTCGRRAAFTLMNLRNAPCGDYCKQHAKAELKRQQKAEVPDPSNGALDDGDPATWERP